MKIRRYMLPEDWDEKIFDNSKCCECKLDLKIENIRALRNKTWFYVYEIMFRNRQKFFLCEKCFTRFIRESLKLLL